MSATLADVAVAPEATTKKSKLPLVLVLVVLLLGGGAAAWFLLGGDGDDAPAEAVDGAIVPLEPLTTTLGEAGLRHARISVALVLADGESPSVVAPKQALLLDAVLREVARMDGDHLRSAEGSDQLRERLSGAAQDIWGEEVVRRVVLTELLVQ